MFGIATVRKDADSVLEFAYSHVFLLLLSTHEPAQMQNQFFGAFNYRFIVVIVIWVFHQSTGVSVISVNRGVKFN
jgi:hypothetical protein